MEIKEIKKTWLKVYVGKSGTQNNLGISLDLALECLACCISDYYV